MTHDASARPKAPGILVVEDEGIVADDLAATLEELGYEVLAIVATGEEAIAREAELSPDLVLMDVRLAGDLDGIETSARIRARREVPIVFLTAHSDRETLFRAKETAPSGYLVKPFRTPDLRCAVEIALHKGQIERRLRDREQWLATTLRSLRDGIVTTNPARVVTFLNPVAEALTGWSEAAAVGRTIDEILRFVDERAVEPPPPNGAARTSRPPARDALLVSRRGETVAVDEWGTPIFDDAGSVLGRIVILRDVTERRRQETEILRLNADLERRVVERTTQLEAANRELEAFSYSVAHDLRAPLRGIDGFSQALIEDHAANLGPEGLSYLDRVRAGAQRMGHLIDDLLQLSRVARSELSRTALNLADLARDVVEELRRSHPGEHVDVEVAPQIPVDGDARTVKIVLENLLSNAWKFTSRKPHRRLRIVRITHEGRPGCSVEDNGAGFDMAAAGKLFGAFQRLHHADEFEGSGIGLAIVQRIVNRHGGRVWATAAVGEGAAFSFHL